MTQAQIIARVEPEIKRALERIKKEQGFLLEHQIRMGVLMWIESRGEQVIEKPRRKRGKAT